MKNWYYLCRSKIFYDISNKNLKQTIKIMENFFWDEMFLTDLGDLIDRISDEEDLSDIDDNWQTECYESKLEKVFELSTDWIMKFVHEERFEEDGDTHEKLYDLLEREIDYEKINSKIPELYYESKNKFILTKQDLLDYIKE